MNMLYVVAPIMIALLTLAPMLFRDGSAERERSLERKPRRAPPLSSKDVWGADGLRPGRIDRTPREESKRQLPGSPEHGPKIIQLRDEVGVKSASLMENISSMIEFMARVNLAVQGYMILPTAGRSRDENNWD
ncbi:hypothetical protein CCAX7_44640 [Capsulimonas corticalis]|uniref:Uncharacterized protein n=1 Tax=Capsulimonas corticalis TaxID=2219043 RepID=A0A402CX52_9BACT|nr:hypothetical protein [Capsulimonas corticalis]BDI32413.1 hypothetical protein CCAX7_44640 [Capsulimonas corticalis]